MHLNTNSVPFCCASPSCFGTEELKNSVMPPHSFTRLFSPAALHVNRTKTQTHTAYMHNKAQHVSFPQSFLWVPLGTAASTWTQTHERKPCSGQGWWLLLSVSGENSLTNWKHGKNWRREKKRPGDIFYPQRWTDIIFIQMYGNVNV